MTIESILSSALMPVILTGIVSTIAFILTSLITYKRISKNLVQLVKDIVKDPAIEKKVLTELNKLAKAIDEEIPDKKK